MTVTWTSGYSIDEAVPFVEWGLTGEINLRSPAGTLTVEQNSMCGTLIYIYILTIYTRTVQLMICNIVLFQLS
jgi:hypothetical protein